jgi:hypothetical protein
VISSASAFRVYLAISAIFIAKGFQFFEIYRTYLNYYEISDIGKESVAGTPLNLRLILEHIATSNNVQILNVSVF